jgi:hypothetical protein
MHVWNKAHIYTTDEVKTKYLTSWLSHRGNPILVTATDLLMAPHKICGEYAPKCDANASLYDAE